MSKNRTNEMLKENKRAHTDKINKKSNQMKTKAENVRIKNIKSENNKSNVYFRKLYFFFCYSLHMCNIKNLLHAYETKA